MSFDAHFKSTVDAFSKRFNTLIKVPAGPEGRVATAMIYATEAGGKRIRPFLVLETARMLGCPSDDDMIFKAAAAVEFIHSYSLVHDDLPAMDNDTMRRGKPTVWTAFDEATAILAGDGLLTLAFETVSDYPAAVRALAKAAGYQGMVGGQMIDLIHAKTPIEDQETLLRLNRMKTGALFTYSLIVSALLLKAPDETVKALSDYADALGLLFQATDDMLDGNGDQKAYAKKCADAALNALRPFGPEADILRALISFILTRDK